GPISTMLIGIELQSASAGVTVRSYAEASPASALTRLLRGAIRSSVADTLDFCDRYLVRKEAGRADPVPVPEARNAVNRAQLDQRVGRLAAAGVRADLIAWIKERILEGSDDQLTGIRPFALADLWRTDRLEVLKLFLHATTAGLVELRWELMCPTCRVPK